MRIAQTVSGVLKGMGLFLFVGMLTAIALSVVAFLCYLLVVVSMALWQAGLVLWVLGGVVGLMLLGMATIAIMTKWERR